MPAPCSGGVWEGGFGHPSAPAWLSPGFHRTPVPPGLVRSGLGLLPARRLCGGKLHPTSDGEAKHAHHPRTGRWAKLRAPLSMSFSLMRASTPAPQHPCPTAALRAPIPPPVQESTQRAPRSFWDLRGDLRDLWDLRASQATMATGFQPGPPAGRGEKPTHATTSRSGRHEDCSRAMYKQTPDRGAQGPGAAPPAPGFGPTGCGTNNHPPPKCG